MSASIVQDFTAWTGVRALVTSASGFIGSHLVRRLTGSGADVHMVSWRPQPDPEGPAWHVANLTDPNACVELVETVTPMCVPPGQRGHRSQGRRPSGSADYRGKSLTDDHDAAGPADFGSGARCTLR